MHLKKYDFSDLPFTELFQAYTNNFSRLSEFYAANPFDKTAVKAHAVSFNFNGDRSRSAQLLKEFNEQFETEEAVFSNIERLRQPESLVIVTGQQLGVYGGPIFTFFKSLSAIQLATQLEQELNRPVIPVFWMADEDHDYDEVRKLQILDEDAASSFSLPREEGNLPPVSEVLFPEDLTEVESSLRSALVESDFSKELWDLLDDCFSPGDSFRKGFGNFVARLFSGHGLVLAGSNDPEIKQQLKEPMVEAVQHTDEIRDALEEQSGKLEESFHQQAAVYDSHLFYLHSEDGRIKIQHEAEEWKTDAGQQWSSDELISDIKAAPEQFSPDVFLRPMLQDTLLPTLGYVAGPGEVAYYGQMKTFYRCFNKQMPVIFPRFSGTFIEPAIVRVFRELPYDLKDYNNRIEDLESDFAERTEQMDIESIFESWKEKAESAAASRIDKIAELDETLEGAGEKVQAAYLNDLDKLKHKVYRSVKKREEIQLNRIRRIQLNLFPNGDLQERTVAGIYFMNKFGVDIWDRLLEEMKESGVESLNSHQLIYL